MRSGILLVTGAIVLAIPACSEPVVANFNSPTVEAAGSDPSSLQLLATGILSQVRATVTGEDLSTGILAREAFNYTPTEGRNTPHYLSAPGGVLSNTQYSFSTRFEEGIGTNPEELIAAAHAGCFSMALSAQLGEAGLVAGHPP